MESVKHQRIFSVVLGMGLLITGSFFVLPLMVAAYIIGLMLIGFGFEPRMGEDSAEKGISAPAASKAVKAVKAKKATKRRKSS
jgi:membrane protein implicated in regulation of membrane protease activity